MSYKFEREHKTIPEEYDRRRKLHSQDYQDIVDLYSTGLYSYKKIALKYGVSKTRIMQICNPTVANRYKNYSKEHRADFKPTKEKHSEHMRRHRRYKQTLAQQNILQ